MNDDMRLKTCFMDGVLKGMAMTLVCAVFVIILFLAMFASPEEKYKMVCEPVCVMNEGGIE